MPLDYSRDLEFALDVSKRAGDVVVGYWTKGVQPEFKSDGTPVTEADRRAEQLIREAIGSAFPADDILGEEAGETEGVSKHATGSSSRKWIIDPIDGTSNFVRGIPVFSTLLALEQNGEIVVGVINAPATQDIFWAAKGHGAYKNGNSIHVSQCNTLEDAYVNFGEMRRLFLHGLQEGFEKILSSTYMHRGFGDYLSFAYVFEGKSDAAVEVGVHSWDLAPMKIIVEEAGGRYSDLEGGCSIYTGNCLISNGLLHDRLLSLLLGKSGSNGNRRSNQGASAASGE